MPLISKKKYEEEREILDKARQMLRATFVEGELMTIPELRVINGLDYKRMDDQLLDEVEALERAWKITRYVASQGKQKKLEPVPHREIVSQPKNPDYRVVWSGSKKRGMSANQCGTSGAFRGKTRREIGDL